MKQCKIAESCFYGRESHCEGTLYEYHHHCMKLYYEKLPQRGNEYMLSFELRDQNLRKLFEKETGLSVVVNQEFNMEYVHWLERKVLCGQ